MKKLALALIVKGSDDEALVLDRCLNSAKDNVDGIFVTITQPNNAVEEVCKKYGAVISHFEWVKDFSKARNFNFAQVTDDFEYTLWLDADDVIDLTGIQDHLAKNYDIYAMNYLYYINPETNEPEVIHMKTRIVRNDGCTEWKGQIHEDLSNTRALRATFIPEISVVHLSNEKRFDQSKIRNLEIAQEQSKELGEDPRAFWNLANAFKGLGNDEEAIRNFNEFFERSQSDEEKYIAHLRIAEIYRESGNLHKALDHAITAIGMFPEFPDAYHAKGHILFMMNDFLKAIQSFQMGLMRPIPKFSINAYNPRDYDFYPFLAMAKCYVNLALPSLALIALQACIKLVPQRTDLNKLVATLEEEAAKETAVLKIIEKLRKVKTRKTFEKKLSEIDPEFQSHPMLCNIRNTMFVKETSSGKDVVFYCYPTDHLWTPETPLAVGGSEEAVLNLSKQFKDAGYNVTVYNNCGHKEQVFNGVTFKPFWSWNYRDKQDVVILWRQPVALDYDINADKVFVDVHDVIDPGEFNKKRVAKLTKVFFKTNAHRVLYPQVPDDKAVIIPNGMDFELFDQNVQKDQYLMVNTSSPDRSLDVLPKLFKEVKKQVPQAKCKWVYGFDVYDKVHAGSKPHMEWKDSVVKAMEDAGIENLGRVSQKDAAKLYLEANVFAYPTEFFEIDCISSKKAQACGAYPVTTDFGALDESVKTGTKIHSTKTKDTWCKPYQFHFGLEGEKEQKEWVDAVVKVLKTPMEDRTEMKEKMKDYSWEVVSSKWIKEL